MGNIARGRYLKLGIKENREQPHAVLGLGITPQSTDMAGVIQTNINNTAKVVLQVSAVNTYNMGFCYQDIPNYCENSASRLAAMAL